MCAYPSFPTNTRLQPKTIAFTTKTLGTSFTSPFTGQSQAVRYSGQYWELDLTFPPLLQADANQLWGFVNGLGGTSGKFHYKLPSKFLMSGTLSTTMSTENNIVSNQGQTGKFGVDGSYRLVQFTDTGSIFPAHASGSAISLGTSNGALFRLATNDTNMSVDEMGVFGITIGLVEAI